MKRWGNFLTQYRLFRIESKQGTADKPFIEKRSSQDSDGKVPKVESLHASSDQKQEKAVRVSTWDGVLVAADALSKTSKQNQLRTCTRTKRKPRPTAMDHRSSPLETLMWKDCVYDPILSFRS